MFCREWRQQLLVLGLLTLAVAATLLGTAGGYTMAPSPEAKFGRSDLLFRLDASDPDAAAADLAAIKKGFGPTELVAHRYERIPGSIETLDLRAQDPRGRYRSGTLALRSGRYPRGTGEVALTDAVASTLEAGVGASLRLGGVDRTVVGLVENPEKLDDEFALIAPTPDGLDGSQSLVALVAATQDQFDAFERHSHSSWDHEWKPRSDRDAASAVLGLAAFGMVLICLVAAAAFVVVAQRRLRQLGMLAAIGATPRHLRLVMLVNGIATGIAAAVAGSAVALAGWVVVGPRLETVASHRVDRFDLPWSITGWGLVLAVLTATVAAWWPARTVARIPVTLALSARPPRPRLAGRSAVLALLLVGAGVVCLARADQTEGLLMTVGTVSTILGVLLSAPTAIRVLGRAARRFPVAVRLTMRDLARYQARSGSALAATSLALGIPVAVVVASTAAEHGADEGNLSDRQMLVRILDTDPDVSIVPDRTAGELASLEAQVDRMAAELDQPNLLPLDAAVDPDVEAKGDFEGGAPGRPAVTLGTRKDEDTFHDVVAYVATPAMLRYYGLNAASLDAETDVLTARPEQLVLRGEDPRVPPDVVSHRGRLRVPAYGSAPATLLAESLVRRRGWETALVGWFLETDKPLTSAQRATAREIAADAGLTIETRFDERRLWALRDGATALGLAFALGILAMTVGLIRSEAAGDLRTLTAAGATSRIRRALTASTAGSLALLGVLIGTLGAYLGLAAGYVGDVGALSRVPVLHLTLLAAGVPLVALVAGWLLAGREPSLRQ
jgi:putative ABC transport system permease protein